MLRMAFNALTSLHGRVAQLRRPTTVDMYSPCKIAPSNYFRFAAGPEYTDIHGREFVIAVDSLKGQFSQIVSFDALPTVGDFKLDYNGNLTSALAFNVNAASVQTALRLLAGLADVTVSGSIAAGFTVVFPGFSVQPVLILPADHATLLDTDLEAVEITVAHSFSTWAAPIIRPGDTIIDAVHGEMTIKEIIEMPDIGGSIMGFRIRCE